MVLKASRRVTGLVAIGTAVVGAATELPPSLVATRADAEEVLGRRSPLVRPCNGNVAMSTAKPVLPPPHVRREERVSPLLSAKVVAA
eukprot:56699-Pleurochrysis_carterae.AAC.1